MTPFQGPSKLAESAQLSFSAHTHTYPYACASTYTNMYPYACVSIHTHMYPYVYVCTYTKRELSASMIAIRKMTKALRNITDLEKAFGKNLGGRLDVYA